ncbi:MAG: AbrB/MazE/SpoVT family DNA-binding domain-containing protein [Algicola sp.]|nr:AbrB/MazE/SpoVT family DNA-binding domain-containing protein [Algicola sp.]
MISTITSKGQVTLPKEIRTQLRLSPGDKLDFFVTDEGYVMAVPVKSPASKLKGFLGVSMVGEVTLEDMQQRIIEGATKV